MAKLSKKLGEMEYDGLITGLEPSALTAGGTIAAQQEEAAVLKRGSLLAKNADGKLVLLGSDVTSGSFDGAGDGSKTVFELVSGGVVPKALTEVKVGGVAVTGGYTYNTTLGTITFDEAPADAAAIAIKYTTGESKPWAILCDDLEVGTDEDVTVPVYIQGCFDPDKCATANGYTLSESDKDELRKLGIIFKAASAAN